MGRRSNSAATTNTTNQTDARTVLDQSGNLGTIAGEGAALGSFNTSTSTILTEVNDYSDRSDRSVAGSFNTYDSRDLSTTVMDWSDRSQTFTDDRDVTYAIDGGAVAGALSFADTIGRDALRTGLDALREAGATTRAANLESVSFARSAIDRVAGSQRDALSFVDSFADLALSAVRDANQRGQAITSGALATVERAYTDAKGEGVASRYATWGALALGGAVALAAILARR